jgi:protease-4
MSRPFRPSPVPALLVLLALAAPAHAKAPTPVPPDLLFGDESAATADGALGLLFNPAGMGVRRPNEILVGYARSDDRHQRNDELATLGGWFGIRSTRIKDVAQYHGLCFAGGGEGFRFGWQPQVQVNGWSLARVLDHRFGILSRPAPWLSLAAVTDHAFQVKLEGFTLPRTYTLAAGIRPLALDRAHAAGAGTRLTFTGDVLLADDGSWRQARVRVGADLEVLPGVSLRGSVQDHGGYHLGMSLRSPRMAWGSSGAFARGGVPGPTSYVVSVNADEERSVLAARRDRRVAVVRAAGALGDEALGGVSLMGGGARTPAESLRHDLERALEDPLTRGVLLDVRGVAGMAQIEELRPRIARLRAAGKPVVAYLEYGGGRGDLYLASACDRVVASPEAGFAALGLRAERRYYRQLLERWGIRMDRSSIGAFKSAYRNFSVDSIPSADREVIEHNLDVAQELFVSAVSADRRMDRARLLGLLDGREWPSSDLAAAGLIDSVGYREDAMAALGRLCGMGARPRAVPVRRLRAATPQWTVPTRLAVVYAAGGIATGRSGGDLLTGSFMGSETVCAQLERAFKDPRVRGVVLRIESPGGDALASDLIHHAAQRLKRETKKPLVVSMGGVAASGGYYIAGPADRILADRFTVTGSIGVVYVKPSLEGLYAKQGVRQQSFQRGDAMAGWSQGRDWDAAAQASADSAVGRMYRSFVGLMAKDRGLPYAAVDSVAQGRPWFGEDARARGLVDAIGGLDDALAEARRRAGIPAGERIRTLDLRRPAPGLVQRLVGGMVREALERDARLPETDRTWLWSDEEAR